MRVYVYGRCFRKRLYGFFPFARVSVLPSTFVKFNSIGVTEETSQSSRSQMFAAMCAVCQLYWMCIRICGRHIITVTRQPWRLRHENIAICLWARVVASLSGQPENRAENIILKKGNFHSQAHSYLFSLSITHISSTSHRYVDAERKIKKYKNRINAK